MKPLCQNHAVLIIGAGTMGAGIAQVAVSGGHRVYLYDAREGLAQQAVAHIHSVWQTLITQGKLTPSVGQDYSTRLLALSQLTALPDDPPIGLAIEAIVENVSAKQALLQTLEAQLSPDCIFATNTSSISITTLAAALRHPQRVAGMHFFNPAPIMALVEIIAGLSTDRPITETLFATAQAWGKTPIEAPATAGFLVNRVARPYYSETLRLVEEGAGDFATLDALCMAAGFRMGPFTLMDMIGLDVNYAVTQSVWQAHYWHPRFAPSFLQGERVDAGWLGKKKGRGFYRYENGKSDRAEVLAIAPQDLNPQTDIKINPAHPYGQRWAKRLTAQNIRYQLADLAEAWAKVNQVSLYRTDGRTAHMLAQNQNPAIVVDWQLGERCSLLAISRSATCSAKDFNSSVALLQKGDCQPILFADSPGLVVARVVAMLINEAATIAATCGAQTIDTAMRLGVHYPIALLQYADQQGIDTLRTLISNLSHYYGEDRYRVAPYLQQLYFEGRNFYDDGCRCP